MITVFKTIWFSKSPDQHYIIAVTKTLLQMKYDKRLLTMTYTGLRNGITQDTVHYLRERVQKKMKG